MKLSRIPVLRKITLPMLKRLSRDIRIKHPWLPSERITLDLFKHKGYWYHGRKREEKTMVLFKKIIQQGHEVVEVGGHIGFITLYLDSLTQPNGKVVVFEPGSNNIPYIEKNIKMHSAINLIKKAVGNEVGTIDFYEDDLTGQNNSIVKDFDGLKYNAEFSHVSTEVKKVSVPLTTLDYEFKGQKVDFIKIDIEGGEWGAIRGAEEVISGQHPALMVEIQANEQDIYDKLSGLGYILFDESCKILQSPSVLKGNTFCLHNASHQHMLSEIFSN